LSVWTQTQKYVFENLINFIQKSGIVLVVINVLKAPPGTELYDRMKRENRLVTEFEFDEDRTNIIPVMDAEILHDGYKNVLSQVYSPEKVYERILTYFKNLNPVKVKNSIRRKVTFKEFGNFIKIIYKLGFLYNGRKYFWKMLLWTLSNKKDYIDLTILFGILMYQYSSLLNSFLEKEKKGILIYSKGKLKTVNA